MIELLVNVKRFEFIITQLFESFWIFIGDIIAFFGGYGPHLISGIAGILGLYGLHLYQRRESRNDKLRNVAADVSIIKDEINRRLDIFNGGKNINFSGFEADNWITIQHERYNPSYGPTSLLECYNQKWFFETLPPLNNGLFDEIRVDLGVLPREWLLKIQEFYKTELHLCNLTLEYPKSCIAQVESAERGHGSSGYSSIHYIRRLLFARKMADEILSEIWN